MRLNRYLGMACDDRALFIIVFFILRAGGEAAHKCAMAHKCVGTLACRHKNVALRIFADFHVDDKEFH